VEVDRSGDALWGQGGVDPGKKKYREKTSERERLREARSTKNGITWRIQTGERQREGAVKEQGERPRLEEVKLKTDTGKINDPRTSRAQVRNSPSEEMGLSNKIVKNRFRGRVALGVSPSDTTWKGGAGGMMRRGKSGERWEFGADRRST